MIALFNVTTTVYQYRGCKDVVFKWFCHSRQRTGQRRAYEHLIENYDARDRYVEYSKGYIDELFSNAEAVALKGYLDREHGDEGTTTITPVELPVRNNTMGLSAIAVGGGDAFYDLDKEESYSLLFKV